MYTNPFLDFHDTVAASHPREPFGRGDNLTSLL
jgi:hypothetical protein